MTVTYYRHGARTEPAIALTFDDGPNPFATPAVLDLLQQYHIKATFFVIGRWAKRFPDIIRNIVSQGHCLGNHSYAHIQGTDDFVTAEHILSILTEKHVSQVRLPYSDLSVLHKVSPSFLARNNIFTFDVDSYDYTNIDAAHIYENVTHQTLNGSIIDLHDGSENEKEWRERPTEMMRALPHIIENLRAQFQFVRVTELSLIPETHTILRA